MSKALPLRQKWIRRDIMAALTEREIERLVRFEEDEPFDILGPRVYPAEKLIVIRVFLPRVDSAWVTPDGGEKTPMRRVHADGLFEAIFENRTDLFDYRISSLDAVGSEETHADPYAFSTEISEFDVQLVGEGNHFQSYEKFGAKPRKFGKTAGVHFAVWAPNAQSVAVIGNFNHWYAGSHPMTRVRNSGVWALFIPGLKEGEVYKYAIRGADGTVHEKSDPYAFRTEFRPNTASVVDTITSHKWKDAKWISAREKSNYLRSPIAAYEVHLGSWMRDEKKGWGFVNYRDLAHALVEHVKQLGYTHIELMPVTEHPLDASWGYQAVNYFAPSSRFGSPEDFMYFVDYCHQNDIGVFLDWVPAHFPKDPHGLNDFDGSQIYAYANWKKGEHREWGTLVFDYGRNEVKNFLISNALFWVDKYHIDGLRVDAVASMLYLDYSRKDGEWEPNQFGGNQNLEAVEFLKRFNEIVLGKFPGVLTIAEESTAWAGVSRPTYAGGLGFSLKWNMGWMHDTLEYFTKDPIYRKYHQGMLTFSLIYAFSENFVLPISHDEVVYGKRSLLEKMPGDDWQKFANSRLFMGYMMAHPGKKLLFMGADIGQRDEWNFDKSQDWHLLNYEPHQRLRQFTADATRLYRDLPALHEMDCESAGFEWIDFMDAESSVLSFVRWSADRRQAVLVVCNMTPTVRHGYRVGVPREGHYHEALNSDAATYGGSGVGNSGGFHTDATYAHNRPYSLNLNLPPLGILYFVWEEK